MSRPYNPFTQERVEKYGKAQERWPRVRCHELDSFYSVLTNDNGHPLKALEIGSGTGFLTRSLLEMGYTVDTVDPAFPRLEGVRSHYPCYLNRGFSSELMLNRYDAIVSLAALHHIAETPDGLPDFLVRDMHYVAAPGAKLILQDVPQAAAARKSFLRGSAIAGTTAEFFERIVEVYSVPDHRGVYVDLNDVAAQFEEYGWKIEKCFWHECPWSFEDMESLSEYLRKLFNLQILENHELWRLVEPYVQYTGTGVDLRWALACLVMTLLP